MIVPTTHALLLKGSMVIKILEEIMTLSWMKNQCSQTGMSINSCKCQGVVMQLLGYKQALKYYHWRQNYSTHTHMICTFKPPTYYFVICLKEHYSVTTTNAQ